jgi:uncharacterized alkaline shock family protein YloU
MPSPKIEKEILREIKLYCPIHISEIEVYMDDMIAKSKKEESFVQVLRKLLERLRSTKLRLKHAKCMFIWS